jgi:ankyrin repeat protein
MQSGLTPLHRACHNGKLEIVQLLIKYGANVNINSMVREPKSYIAHTLRVYEEPLSTLT